jgi:WD40 repeat protein
VAFSPCGTFIVAGLYNSLVQMRSLVDEGFKRDFQGHDESTQSILFSLCGYFLITGSSDNTVKIRDSATGMCQATVDCEGGVNALTFLPGRQEVLAGTFDEKLVVIGMNGVKRREVQVDGRVTALARAADAVVVGLYDGRL